MGGPDRSRKLQEVQHGQWVLLGVEVGDACGGHVQDLGQGG